MKIIVTGSSNGMGKEICRKFLDQGHNVVGLDIQDSDISMPNYTHVCCDVSDKNSLPDVQDVNILVNNAGIQRELDEYSGEQISVNLKGVMNCTEKYALNNSNLVSVLNQASVSAHTGAEFPEYCASKGGVLTYTKWTANQVAKFGATCNSISCGGVLTDLNRPIIDDEDCWNAIMELTPLRKWCSPEEIADWVYFLTVTNKSCTGQDIIIDNGETVKTNFIWK